MTRRLLAALALLAALFVGSAGVMPSPAGATPLNTVITKNLGSCQFKIIYKYNASGYPQVAVKQANTNLAASEACFIGTFQILVNKGVQNDTAAHLGDSYTGYNADQWFYATFPDATWSIIGVLVNYEWIYNYGNDDVCADWSADPNDGKTAGTVQSWGPKADDCYGY